MIAVRWIKIRRPQGGAEGTAGARTPPVRGEGTAPRSGVVRGSNGRRSTQFAPTHPPRILVRAPPERGRGPSASADGEGVPAKRNTTAMDNQHPVGAVCPTRSTARLRRRRLHPPRILARAPPERGEVPRSGSDGPAAGWRGGSRKAAKKAGGRGSALPPA